MAIHTELLPFSAEEADALYVRQDGTKTMTDHLVFSVADKGAYNSAGDFYIGTLAGSIILTATDLIKANRPLDFNNLPASAIVGIDFTGSALLNTDKMIQGTDADDFWQGNGLLRITGNQEFKTGATGPKNITGNLNLDAAANIVPQKPIMFGNLGAATKMIDGSASGLSGASDYWIYNSAANYWTAAGSLIASGAIQGGVLRANSYVVAYDMYPATAISLKLQGRPADGAAAIGTKIGCITALTIAGAKIVSFYSDWVTTEKAYIDKDGMGAFNSVMIASNGAKQSNNTFYSKGDNKLYYKTNAGVEEEIAFVP